MQSKYRRTTCRAYLIALWNPAYNVRYQNEIAIINHDIFRPNDMDDFCDLAKNVIKPSGYGYVISPALQSFTCWYRLLSLVKVKYVVDGG